MVPRTLSCGELAAVTYHIFLSASASIGMHINITMLPVIDSTPNGCVLFVIRVCHYCLK